MRILVFVMCAVLSGMFIYDFRQVNTRNGWKSLIRVSIDAFLIIAFAIIEGGRW